MCEQRLIFWLWPGICWVERCTSPLTYYCVIDDGVSAGTVVLCQLVNQWWRTLALSLLAVLSLTVIQYNYFLSTLQINHGIAPYLGTRYRYVYIAISEQYWFVDYYTITTLHTQLLNLTFVFINNRILVLLSDWILAAVLQQYGMNCKHIWPNSEMIQPHPLVWQLSLNWSTIDKLQVNDSSPHHCAAA